LPALGAGPLTMSEMLVSLVCFAIVATITPGGATTLATAAGAQFGFRRSIPLLSGIAVGLALLAAATAAGLAAVLQAAPSLQFAMKVVGSAYLLWLACKISGSRPPQKKTNDSATPPSFGGGILLLCLNPKAWAMTLGAAASFAALAANPFQLALLLGATFGLAAVVSLSLWCAGGVILARMVRTDRQWRIVNMVLGLLLTASIVPMWLE
jgi:threonine/homoserine/homoserine lactone efflux protein